LRYDIIYALELNIFIIYKAKEIIDNSYIF